MEPAEEEDLHPRQVLVLSLGMAAVVFGTVAFGSFVDNIYLTVALGAALSVTYALVLAAALRD